MSETLGQHEKPAQDSQAVEGGRYPIGIVCFRCGKEFNVATKTSDEPGEITYDLCGDCKIKNNEQTKELDRKSKEDRSMYSVCSGCGKVLGFVNNEKGGVTHGMCEVCMNKTTRSIDQDIAREERHMAKQEANGN